MSIINDYLAKFSPDRRKPLETIRDIAIQVVPDAKESLSYGMPAMKYKGKSFIGFNAHKDHIGIYPFGREEIDVFKSEIEHLNLKHTAGAIQLPYDTPIPEDLIVKIIRHRIARL